jgi:hypothetical protein
MTSNARYFSTVYPQYSTLIRFVEGLPLSTRSLLIKLCQSQSVPTHEHSSLATLIDKEGPFRVQVNQRTVDTLSLRDALNIYNFNPYDPLDSAILLDICRGTSTSSFEISAIKEKSWCTEINLVQGVFREDYIHWNTIFSEHEPDRHLPLHHLLPSNPSISNTLHYVLRAFRARIAGSTLHPRYGRKNMSRATRRDYEQTFGESLEDVPIFSQEDWCRVYNQTGIMLDGAVEMRQRWYTSGAKPRTYFAMGGISYRHSRFLQDFFTKLVDSLPSTNHKTRLRPNRLSTPDLIDDEVVNWRIYDLSSFTSNCCVQRSFVKALGEFFAGVPVFIVDEYTGAQEVDIGDLLVDYYTHCVEEPLVSLERYDSGLEHFFEHEVASMLGIFGNLMTCTFAHASILLPIVDSFEKYNCAGDDGIIPERLSTEGVIDDAIRIVGDYAREKSFRGDEEGAIHLKRPFCPGSKPSLLQNIIPPTVATVIEVLSDFDDPRFRSFVDYDLLSLNQRISIVGRDLLRFLRSAYRLQYQDVESLSVVVRGFSRLVTELSGVRPKGGLQTLTQPLWPLDPLEYEFIDNRHDPLQVLIAISGDRQTEELHEFRNEEGLECVSVGDTFEANPNKRLRLLTMLGYLEYEDVYVEILDPLAYWSRRLYVVDAEPIPVVRAYSVVKDIPPCFVYSLL